MLVALSDGKGLPMPRSQVGPIIPDNADDGVAPEPAAQQTLWPCKRIGSGPVERTPSRRAAPGWSAHEVRKDSCFQPMSVTLGEMRPRREIWWRQCAVGHSENHKAVGRRPALITGVIRDRERALLMAVGVAQLDLADRPRGRVEIA